MIDRPFCFCGYLRNLVGGSFWAFATPSPACWLLLPAFAFALNYSNCSCNSLFAF
nr:MAG TPA: hypothetical protein [Caudoviricetes sp.]